MATIAKSSITLVSISDAYSVSLQPSNIVINADPYGNNAKLENAFTIISLYCGDIQVPISSAKVVGSSLWGDGKISQKQDYSLDIVGDSVKLSILSIGNQLSGWREIEVFTNAGQKLTARFSYTVVRETTMLDWILEWDKNLTEITGDHVATPNAFIGNKDNDGNLTGVYIGGGENHPYLPGIYGFKGCVPEAFAQGNLGLSEIFHLNENGGIIGGWNISNTGLIKENSIGRLEILSEGTIKYINSCDATTPFWELRSDGSGSLASGHITWLSNGNTTFDGKIKAKSGEIGEWNIGSHSLYNNFILLDSSLIGVRVPNNILFTQEPTSEDFYDLITRDGGVAIHCIDSTHYGLEGWLQGTSSTKGTQIFGLGSKNFIASWNIGVDALWRGILENTAGNFTCNSGDITIGSHGIRGPKFRLEADGSGAIAGGNIWWEVDGKVHFTNQVSLSWLNITGKPNLTKIDANGLYTGVVSADNITTGTLSAERINADELLSNGTKWALLSDGSGYLASKNLSWDKDGNLIVKGKISTLSTFTDGEGNDTTVGQYITDTANELLVVEYSATGADGTWHSTYTNGDRYMRQSSDGGNTWSGAMLITAQDVTITNQSVEYATSASGTTAPTAGWSTTIPSVAEGQYLWTRTTLTFSDGNSVVSYSVSRQGVDGNSGSDYAPNLLVDSKGPRTITASSSNNTTYMVFDFDTPIEVKSGDKFTVSFGNIEVLAGSPTEFTAALYNVSGTGWGTYGSSVHVTKDKPWGTMTVSKSILARHLLVYAGKYGATAGNSVKYTDVMLTKGETPAKWVPAASEMLAPVITSQSVTYAKSTTAEQPSDASFTYSSISAANPAQGDYLWTKTVVNYSDGTSTKSYTVSRLGADGTEGTPGAQGADGKTQYTHIAYAQGATGELPHPTAFTKFQTTAFDGAEYIGFRHDFDQLDPLDHTLYEWSKYKGKDGAGYTPNLLKGTQEVTVNNSYAKIGFDEPQDFLNGEKYTVSVEGIENLIGSATEYSVVLFRNAGGDLSNGILCPVVTLTKEKPYATMTLYSTATKENKVELFLYAGKHGSTVGNSVKYTKVMLSKGDNPMPWVPAASEMVGKDAPYSVFQWAKGDYAQPTGTWSDTPLNALPGEFVWMREGVVTPPATTPVWKSGYTRVTGDTGAAGTNYTPNMLTNSKDNKIHVVEKDSDSYKEWRNSTVHLVYKKTYTISARTNAAAFTGDHQDALVSHPDACALLICSDKGSPQGFVNEVVSSADMATDGSKGSVFTWMKPTAGYFLRTNFYKSGTWYVNHVKIEEGDNPNPSWTPHPDEMVGTPGTNGINGQDVFLLDLDNEMVPVTCDAKGNVISGLPATITARVFKGGTELTSGVTYRNQGTTLTVSQSGNKFEIKGIGKDRDTLVIEAVVAGLTLRSTVNVYKVKPGEDGAPATMYFLEPAESSVTRTAQGGLSVASLGCRKLYVTGSDQRHLTTANTLTAQIYTNGVAGTETVIAADGVTNNGVVTLNDDTTAVVFTLYKGASTAEADMLDRERVPVLTDAFGLSVGGVNLLRKTNSGIINWTANTSSNGQIVMEPGTPQSRCVFYNNATTAAPDWQMIGFALPADTIKANCYYMLSFKARVLQSNGTAGGALTQPLQLRWQISKSTGGDRLTNVESRTVTYTETRFTIMMRTTGVPTSQHRLWGHISTTGTAWEALEIWDMQLEEGVVATEYKASPLDFNYLTEALKESTTVEGGVILSSLMRLGYTASDAYRVTAGMNGVLAPSTDGTDPAIWAGGDMLDATSDENSSADLDSLAKLMFRHNGNGYMCGGVVRVLDGRILIGRNRKADGTIKSDAEFAQDCIILDEEGLTYVSGGQDRLLVTSAQVGDTFETKVNAVNWSGTATAFDSIALAHYYNKIYLLEPVQPVQPASEDDTESQNELPYTEVWSWVPTINIAQTKTINIGSGTIAVGTVIEVSSLSTSFSITRSHSEGVQITATAELCYTDSAGKVQVVRKVNMPKQYSGNTCSFSMGTTIRHTVQVAASYFVRLTLTPNTDGMGKPLANEYKTVTPATATASGTTKTTRSDVTIIGTDGIKSIWGDGGFLANSNGVKIRGSLWINGKLVTG